MPATTQSRGAAPVAYQPRRPALADRALDRAVRESLRQLRSACPRTLDGSSSQQFSDVSRGRPLGTLALSRALRGARRAGAPVSAALQVVRSVEAFVLVVWDGEALPSAREALLAETQAQAVADAAQVEAVLSTCAGSLDAAIEHTARSLTAQQSLLAALMRARGI